MTGCTCKDPGYCERHKVQKNSHWHKLCKTREDYFNAWEEGRGPGQNIGKAAKMPPVVTQVWNLATSIASFVASGCAMCTKEEYETRLAQCDKCNQRVGRRCALCGCGIDIKAKGKAFKCPINKWDREGVMNSLVTIVHGGHEWNPGRVMPVIERAAANDSCHELIIMDMSKERIPECESLSLRNKKVRHEWTKGYNLYYAGALNLAAELAQYENLVYFSSKRGRINDDRWIDSITRPLSNERCGMAGNVIADAVVYSFICEDIQGIPPIHVQGGVFATKTKTLLDHPYSHRFPHEFSDVWISWNLQKSGLLLFGVPEIRSIPIGVVDNPERYQFVMDYS